MSDPARDAMAAMNTLISEFSKGKNALDFNPLVLAIRALEADLTAMNAARELADEAWGRELRGATLLRWKARAEAAEARLAEADVALRAAKIAMDGFDPRDCPHGSPKGQYDTRAQALVDAFLSNGPAGRGSGEPMRTSGQVEGVSDRASAAAKPGGVALAQEMHDRNRRRSAETRE